MNMTISLNKFRQALDNIKDPRDSAMLKLAYLGAYRNCELCSNVSPSELLQNRSKPYGNFLKVKLQNYIVSPATDDREAVIEKVLLITSAIAKRGKRIKRKGVEEDNKETLSSFSEQEILKAFQKFGQLDLFDQVMSKEVEVNPQLIKVLLSKIFLKVIALPTTPEYEPWTMDIIKYMVKVKKKQDLSFNITRKHFWKILRDNLSGILPSKGRNNIKNPLRHFRLTHLTEYYQFEPYDLTLISGWTVGTTFGALGIRASANIDSYVHLRWQSYFPKLLQPIKQFY